MKKKLISIMLATGLMFSSLFTTSAGAAELTPEEREILLYTLIQYKCIECSVLKMI